MRLSKKNLQEWLQKVDQYAREKLGYNLSDSFTIKEWIDMYIGQDHKDPVIDEFQSSL